MAWGTQSESGGIAGVLQGGRCAGATFPEFLVMIGLLSLAASLIVPAIMRWAGETDVSRTIRADCQAVILDQVRGAGSPIPQDAKDCPTAALDVPRPAASAASAPASGAAARASAAR